MNPQIKKESHKGGLVSILSLSHFEEFKAYPICFAIFMLYFGKGEGDGVREIFYFFS